MLCPMCRSEDTQVKDSRPSEDGTSIRRRRQCGSCGARFTTFERVQLREISVLKRDGRKVPFNRESWNGPSILHYENVLLMKKMWF